MLFTLYRKASPDSQALLRAAIPPELLKPFVQRLKDNLNNKPANSQPFQQSEPSLEEKATALMQIMYLPEETARLEAEARRRAEEEGHTHHHSHDHECGCDHHHGEEDTTQEETKKTTEKEVKADDE